MFPQLHHAGGLAACDFTNMNALRVTIAGQPFDHILYHFTLTYSNGETVSVCFSESFEALKRETQPALDAPGQGKEGVKKGKKEGGEKGVKQGGEKGVKQGG